MKRWLIPLGCLGVLALAALALLVLLIYQPTSASQLAEARSRWAARPFTRYRLIVERSDGLSGVCDYAIEVTGQAVTTVSHNTCVEPPETVDGLLGWIERTNANPPCGPNGCACDGPILAQADYDAQLGYPREIVVSTTPSARSWNLIDLFSGRGCTRVGFIGPRRRVHALTPLP